MRSARAGDSRNRSPIRRRSDTCEPERGRTHGPPSPRGDADLPRRRPFPFSPSSLPQRAPWPSRPSRLAIRSTAASDSARCQRASLGHPRRRCFKLIKTQKSLLGRETSDCSRTRFFPGVPALFREPRCKPNANAWFSTRAWLVSSSCYLS